MVDGSLATADEEHFGRYRVSVDGVTVRFDEGMHGVTVTIEGELPQGTTNSILSQLKQKLTSIEQAEYKTTVLS